MKMVHSTEMSHVVTLVLRDAEIEALLDVLQHAYMTRASCLDTLEQYLHNALYGENLP